MASIVRCLRAFRTLMGPRALNLSCATAPQVALARCTATAGNTAERIDRQLRGGPQRSRALSIPTRRAALGMARLAPSRCGGEERGRDRERDRPSGRSTARRCAALMRRTAPAGSLPAGTLCPPRLWRGPADPSRCSGRSGGQVNRRIRTRATPFCSCYRCRSHVLRACTRADSVPIARLAGAPPTSSINGGCAR